MQATEQFLSTFIQKEKQRFKVKIGVFLFLMDHDNILLLRRYKTGIDDGKYVVPMGSVDKNETLTTAIIRETQEEANIIISPELLQVRHVMYRYHSMPHDLSFEQMDVFFYTQTYQGIIKNNEPHKCDELKFYPVSNLPINTVPFIKSAIENMRKGQFFSEFGW